MKLSTRGRYAVRSLIDLSIYADSGFVSLQSISERQEISLHYLEQIFHKLKKSGIVKSKKGLGGGYLLAREAKDVSIGDILRAVEGPIAPVACLAPATSKDVCHRAKNCTARVLWGRLEEKMESFLDGVSLQDVKEEAIKQPCE